MEEIAAKLATITGLRAHAFPADSITPPTAVVGYPETITFDTTMGRGVDSMQLPIIVFTGRLTDRAAQELLGAYLNGSGSKSIKAVILAGKPWTAMSTVRVASATVEVLSVARIEYLAAVFMVDVTGPGE